MWSGNVVMVCPCIRHIRHLRFVWDDGPAESNTPEHAQHHSRESNGCTKSQKSVPDSCQIRSLEQKRYRRRSRCPGCTSQNARTTHVARWKSEQENSPPGLAAFGLASPDVEDASKDAAEGGASGSIAPGESRGFCHAVRGNRNHTGSGSTTTSCGTATVLVRVTGVSTTETPP